MLNLFYPAHLKLAFSYMNYANFDNPVTQFLGGLLVESINLVSVSVNAQFQSLGFGSTNILVNSMDKLLMILFLFLITLFIFLLFCIMKKQSN
jgi:hypothetical protein